MLLHVPDDRHRSMRVPSLPTRRACRPRRLPGARESQAHPGRWRRDHRSGGALRARPLRHSGSRNRALLHPGALVRRPTAPSTRSSAGSTSDLAAHRLGACGSAAALYRPGPSTRPGENAEPASMPTMAGSSCSTARAAQQACGGDLLQAGPMLVSNGPPMINRGEDAEGFSAGSRPVRLRHHRRPFPERVSASNSRRPCSTSYLSPEPCRSEMWRIA